MAFKHFWVNNGIYFGISACVSITHNKAERCSVLLKGKIYNTTEKWAPRYNFCHF